MILFAILRRAAGNYGRWALVRKNEDSDTKWTQLFYAPDDVSVEEDSEHAENRIGTCWSHVFTKPEFSICNFFSIKNDSYIGIL